MKFVISNHNGDFRTGKTSHFLRYIFIHYLNAGFFKVF